MNILYNHWNYFSDKPGISSPDGGAFYLFAIFDELLKRGHKIYCGPVDRDKEIVKKYKKDAFKAFYTDKRYKMYNNLIFIDIKNPPKVDLLINEWRFATKDNSLSPGDARYTPDLRIQSQLLEHYSKQKNTKIVIWDLDYKFTKKDENRINPWKTIETALKPRRGHLSVYVPFDFSNFFQCPTGFPHRNSKMVYVGNYYDRDKDFQSKIFDYANKNPGTIKLYGNWLKDSLADVRNNNKGISFNDRVSFNEFEKCYYHAMSVPLLAKEEYKKNGFMTIRIIEALFFGSIPIGFSDFYKIKKWLPPKLIVDVNNLEKSLEKVMNYLEYQTGFLDRIELRKRIVLNLTEIHSAYNFVEIILEGFK